ncbi:unnamed protein product [Cuscuta campestris]|uniref:Uncharacterized protein n=1 Tax=Cuscuta campestris TaxID=132261 RepID=A0A484L3P9_9ASTE|nr:unnamed protein product [Cuscuta campestris]
MESSSSNGRGKIEQEVVDFYLANKKRKHALRQAMERPHPPPRIRQIISEKREERRRRRRAQSCPPTSSDASPANRMRRFFILCAKSNLGQGSRVQSVLCDLMGESAVFILYGAADWESINPLQYEGAISMGVDLHSGTFRKWIESGFHILDGGADPVAVGVALVNSAVSSIMPGPYRAKDTNAATQVV